MPRNEGMWHCAAAAGYGCHPARQIALMRALTEAAQTRLTVISGLRDDFRGDTYEQLQDWKWWGQFGITSPLRERHAAFLMSPTGTQTRLKMMWNGN
jgi:Uncharacterized conserved protein